MSEANFVTAWSFCLFVEYKAVIGVAASFSNDAGYGSGGQLSSFVGLAIPI